MANAYQFPAGGRAGGDCSGEMTASGELQPPDLFPDKRRFQPECRHDRWRIFSCAGPCARIRPDRNRSRSSHRSASQRPLQFSVATAREGIHRFDAVASAHGWRSGAPLAAWMRPKCLCSREMTGTALGEDSISCAAAQGLRRVQRSRCWSRRAAMIASQSCATRSVGRPTGIA